MTKTKATRNEVEDLKASWKGDPCWDLYDTEGFEEYKDELKAFQDKWETHWKNENKQSLQALADKWQCSPETASYIDYLDSQMEKMQEKIDELRHELRHSK